MGNKHTKKSKLPETTDSVGLYQSVINTEIYNSQDSFCLNSDEPIEAIEEIVNASHKNALLPNIQAFMSSNIYTGPFQIDQQSNCTTVLDDTETTDFQAVPCDETQNSRMTDSQLPTAVEATQGIQDKSDFVQAWIIQTQTELFETTVGTQTDLANYKEGSTQTEEDITEGVVKYSLDILTKFSKIENDNDSSALLNQSSFVTKNREQIQSLAASLQTLLSTTDFVPEKFATSSEPCIPSPREAENVSDIESPPKNEIANKLETDPELQSEKSDVSSLENEVEDHSNKTENVPVHPDLPLIEQLYLQTVMPCTSNCQFSMVSNTEELPSFPKKKTLWKRFKKGISKPLRIFKR